MRASGDEQVPPKGQGDRIAQPKWSDNAELDSAFTSFREVLLAGMARVVGASPAGSAKGDHRFGSPSNTRRSRSKKKSRRRRDSSSSSSGTTTSSSSSGKETPEPRGTTSKPVVLSYFDDRFAKVLDYRTYRLQNRSATYGPHQAGKMGRTARNMRCTFGTTSDFTGEEPLKIFTWLRKFVHSCDYNAVLEGMALYLIPHFLAGEAETRFTRYLPGGVSDESIFSLPTYPYAVNWLLSTYAEPHTLSLAQDAFSPAAVREKETVEAFAIRLRKLAELCGNIHSEGAMKQQLIQGLPEYFRADAFVYNESHPSYQQLATYVGGKLRSAMDVEALARYSGGPSTRRLVAGTSPRGPSSHTLALTVPPEEEDPPTLLATVADKEGSPGTNPPRQETPQRPPLCYLCWTIGHRVAECRVLTEKLRELSRGARMTFLRNRGRTEGKPPGAEQGALVAAIWNDLVGDMGFDWSGIVGEGPKTPEAAPKGRHDPGNA
ncbi:hypothetical protein MMPV_008456 [Pyropia vietnamensis]